MQDEVLWEHGHEGAERCAAIIRNRYGVARTPEAVKRHAYRIGAPIVQYEICPRCGSRVQHLGPHGVCYPCRQAEHAEEQRAENRAILAEIRGERDGEAARNAERDYEKWRKVNSRLRKKHGIEPRRKRYGGSAKDVTEMSNASS